MPEPLLCEISVSGRQGVRWFGRDAAGVPVGSGVYFCVLEAGGRRLERKMVLMR